MINSNYNVSDLTNEELIHRLMAHAEYNKLDIAKKVIKEYYTEAQCGIFDSRNIVGDPMATIYNDDSLTIDICYHYGYFEVFGLTDIEFQELASFYTDLENN